MSDKIAIDKSNEEGIASFTLAGGIYSVYRRNYKSLIAMLILTAIVVNAYSFYAGNWYAVIVESIVAIIVTIAAIFSMRIIELTVAEFIADVTNSKAAEPIKDKVMEDYCRCFEYSKRRSSDIVAILYASALSLNSFIEVMKYGTVVASASSIFTFFSFYLWHKYFTMFTSFVKFRRALLGSVAEVVLGNESFRPTPWLIATYELDVKPLVSFLIMRNVMVPVIIKGIATAVISKNVLLNIPVTVYSAILMIVTLHVASKRNKITSKLLKPLLPEDYTFQSKFQIHKLFQSILSKGISGVLLISLAVHFVMLVISVYLLGSAVLEVI